MTDITRLRRELVTRVLESDAQAPPALRRAAFENTDLDEPVRTLVGKVAGRAYQVTDDDVSAATAAGLSEDQIFEIVVAAAVGQATRQYDNARAALAQASRQGQ